MDTQVDIAICLRQWAYSETSQTAALLSRTHGVVRVLGKGTKRADPRFSGGLEIGTLGEAVFVPKANSNLAILAGWDLRETYRRSRSDLQTYYAVMFALEVAINLLPEGEPHPVSFEALSALLGSLQPDNWQRQTAEFLWALLSDAGFRPSVEEQLSPPIVFLPAHGKLISDQASTPGSTKWLSASAQTTTKSSLYASGHSSSTPALPPTTANAAAPLTTTQNRNSRNA